MADDQFDFLDEVGVDELGQPLPANPPTPAPELAPVPVAAPVQQVAQAPAPEPAPAAPAPAPDPFSFLDAPLTPEPLAPAASTDPFSFLDAAPGGAAPEPQVPQAPDPNDFSAFLDDPRPELGEAFTEAVARGTQELYIGLTEDLPGVGIEALADIQEVTGLGTEEGTQELRAAAQVRGQRAEAFREKVRANSPEPVVANYTEINNINDATYWAVERFGEQVPNLLAFGLSGGTGAGVAIASRALGAVKLTPKIGAAIGGFLSSASLETAFIASEQFEATRSFNPVVTIPAGIAAGALEFFAPFKFLREVQGKGALLSFIKTPLREAATEELQELIAVTAREYTDPNYTFFSEQTKIRLIEAPLAGGIVGLPFGSISSIQAAVTRDKKPGARPPPKPPRPGPQEGPLAWLRTRKRNIERQSDVVGPEARTTPVEDPIETNYLDDELNRQWRGQDVKGRRIEKLLDLEDDNLPRYVILDADGKGGNQIHTATGLEEELARRGPQAEKPRIQQINMGSLQPGLITADVFDLPPAGDPRVWFMPGVTEQEKAELEAEYLAFQSTQVGVAPTESVRLGRGQEAQNIRDSFEAQYSSLLNRGLRVIPSRGQGFSYNGRVEAQGTELSEVPATRRSVQTFTLDTNSLVLTPLPKDQEVVRGIGLFGETPNLEPVAIDLDQMPPGSFKELPDGTLQLTQPAPEGALTFGYAMLGDVFLAPMSPRVISAEGNVLNHIKVEGTPVKIHQRAARVARWIREFQPFLVDLQKKLGIRNLVRYVVLEEASPSLSSGQGL